MRTLLIILAVSSIFVSACNKPPKTNHTEESKETVMKIPEEYLLTLDFEVHGMTCTGCEKAVSASVGNLDGIQSVNASHIDSNTVVSFDKTKTDPDKITEAIRSAGYEVIAYAEKANPE